MCLDRQALGITKGGANLRPHRYQIHSASPLLGTHRTEMQMCFQRPECLINQSVIIMKISKSRQAGHCIIRRHQGSRGTGGATLGSAGNI